VDALDELILFRLDDQHDKFTAADMQVYAVHTKPIQQYHFSASMCAPAIDVETVEVPAEPLAMNLPTTGLGLPSVGQAATAAAVIRAGNGAASEQSDLASENGSRSLTGRSGLLTPEQMSRKPLNAAASPSSVVPTDGPIPITRASPGTPLGTNASRSAVNKGSSAEVKTPTPLPAAASVAVDIRKTRTPGDSVDSEYNRAAVKMSSAPPKSSAVEDGAAVPSDPKSQVGYVMLSMAPFPDLVLCSDRVLSRSLFTSGSSSSNRDQKERTEQALLSRMDRLFAKHYQSVVALVESERKAREEAEKERSVLSICSGPTHMLIIHSIRTRLQSLLQSISGTVNSTVPEQIEVALKTELQKSIMPALSKLVTQSLQVALAKVVLPAVNKAVKEAVTEQIRGVLTPALLSESVSSAIDNTQAIHEGLQQNFRTSFQSLLLPVTAFVTRSHDWSFAS